MEQARRSTTRWRRRAVQVGGDRHDAFQVSDGSTELVVGDVWPVGFAVVAWTPEVEDRIAAIVRAAVS